MRFLLSIFAAGIAYGQSFSPPLVGMARDETNRLRPVYGMAGNFIAGQAAGDEVVSMAFSGKAGIAKTETQLLLLDESGVAVTRYPAPPGTALFAFGADGMPAFCYFESTGELWRIAANTLDPVKTAELEQDDEALALSAVDGLVRLISRKTLGQTDGPVLAIAGGLLRAAGKGLLWQPDGASQIEISIAGEVRSLEQIGDGWVRVAASEGDFALRIPTGMLYRLPRAGTPK